MGAALTKIDSHLIYKVCSFVLVNAIYVWMHFPCEFLSNIFHFKIDNRHNVLYVHGSLPGHKGSILRLYDSRRRPFKQAPPFPTASEIVDTVVVMPKVDYDPLERRLSYPQ